jgi:pyruvate,water dikinase
MNGTTLPLADAQATLEAAGGKGASLARLMAAGLPVPDGFHVTTEAYRRFVAENGLQPAILEALKDANPLQPDTLEAASRAIREAFGRAPVPGDIAAAVMSAYRGLGNGSPAVAVRSSATAEDLPEASFAGQQETYLNVTGGEAVVEAVRRCWASLWTARAIAYRMRQGIDPNTVSLAVVVQELVPAEAAGILFTANPVTGQRNQAMINAAWGLGEAIVGGLVTPDTLTVDTTTGRVVERRIAHKEVMTVRVDGTTAEQPVPESLRDAPVLDDANAAELARLGEQIEELYGQPMDIEWTLASGRFAIVQARPITALGEAPAGVPAGIPAAAPAAVEWIMPNPKGFYMRASITELTPDPLSPLYATLGMEAITNGINVLGERLLRLPRNIFVDFMVTINGYAYQSVSYTRRQWVYIVFRMLPHFPKVMREGVPYWREVAHPRYAEVTAHWSARSLPGLTAGELWAGVCEIVDAFGIHLGALMGSTMGPTAGSEGLFTLAYQKLAMRPGDPPAPAFLMGYDSTPIRAEKALYDLAAWCRDQAGLAAYLTATPAEQIADRLSGEAPPDGILAGEWGEWQARFRDHLDRFGYAIYDMDFMKSLPMDAPEPILEALKLFITGQGKDPYERQQAFAARREQAVATIRPRLRGFRRWAFEKTLKWAQSNAPLREDGLAEIGLGYPALRQMLRELGGRLAEAGMIEQADDIYWLEKAEVESAAAALDRGDPLPDAAGSVIQRKAEWRLRKQAVPPATLPVKGKYLGMEGESMTAIRTQDEDGNVLHGIGTSPGQKTGTARVLHGPEDFDQMQPGDVLVASITTPAWTPLFAMASAIVTDIGGPLSHSSIVAREYGIPAVLGTGAATKRIISGQTITVDGSAGTVTLSEDRLQV